MKHLKYLPPFRPSGINYFFSCRPISHDGGNGKKTPREEKEKRMGVFHYNEGNKNFKEDRLNEAVSNHKKAPHRNKNFI